MNVTIAPRPFRLPPQESSAGSCQDPATGILDLTFRILILHPGCWILEPESWILITTLDPGIWILDPGTWIQDAASRPLRLETGAGSLAQNLDTESMT